MCLAYSTFALFISLCLSLSLLMKKLTIAYTASVIFVAFCFSHCTRRWTSCTICVIYTVRIRSPWAYLALWAVISVSQIACCKKTKTQQNNPNTNSVDTNVKNSLSTWFVGANWFLDYHSSLLSKRKKSPNHRLLTFWGYSPFLTSIWLPSQE